MKNKLMDVLACPKCQGDLTLHIEQEAENEIKTGSLSCKCGETYPIIDFIPRFVPMENYSDSFGFQWNMFPETQADSANKTGLSRFRFFDETPWSEQDDLTGKWILDAGCGSGRFSEIALETKAEIISVDISNAVDACRNNLKDKPNGHFIQASITALPIKQGILDGIYCIGVIQHTPVPKDVFNHLPLFIKKDGELAVTFYPKRWSTYLYAKYWIRPITKRIPKKVFFYMLKFSMPILFPLTYILFNIPILGKLFWRIIPVANYVDVKELSIGEKYRWALLDTFDMLTPAYDQPQVHEEASKLLMAKNISVESSSYEGNIQGSKK